MANTTLRALVNQAERLVRSGVCEETIALCQAVLRRYPRYARCYRILGQAYLGLAEYEEAAKLFRRALGVDPEDPIAYAGLGVIFEERGLLDEAIWQLERAYELSPGRDVLRRELVRLYQRRGSPARVQMTRAALARVYMRAGLWNKAIGELRELLAREPYRLDLRTTLVRTLWRMQRRREAAEMAQEIIDQAPNCLVACLVLGTYWCQEGREPEGRALLLAAQELDPENREAVRLLGRESLLTARAAPMDMADVVEADTEATEEEYEGELSWSETEPVAEREPGELEDGEVAAEEHIVTLPTESLPTLLLDDASPVAAVDLEVPVLEAAPPPDGMALAVVAGVAGEEEATAEGDAQQLAAQEPAPTLLSPEAVLRRRLELAPDDHEARLALARALAESGELGEALSLYDNLATTMTGMLEVVLVDLETIALSNPRHRALRELMGDAYARAGRFQEAMAMYRWLLAADDADNLGKA